MLLKIFFTNQKNPLANVISCATDGAPAMVGRHRGFIAHLKKSSPGVFSIHCFVHRQHLVAKDLGERLHKSLNVISAINKIKVQPLNDRLFQKLCHENDGNLRGTFYTQKSDGFLKEIA